MTDVSRLTLGDALASFGFFGLLFAIAVSGPSVLSLLQYVFVDHELVPALQWIVEGYDRLVGVLGAAFEPVLQHLIDWVNASLGLHIRLSPHWRALFVLMMVVVGSLTREAWRSGDQGTALAVAVFLTIISFLGTVATGLLPQVNAWWGHGLTAALPVAILSAASLAIVRPVDPQASSSDYNVGILFIAIAFVAGSLLALHPFAASHAGVLGLGAMMAVMGLLALFGGLSIKEPPLARIGLTILGGFMVAACVLSADYALRIIAYSAASPST